MRTRRLVARLACLVLAAGASGCVDGAAIEKFVSVDFTKTLFQSRELLGIMAEGSRHGTTIAGAALVLLCLVLGFKAYQGQPWLGLAKECFIGGIVCLFILTTYQRENGVVRGAANIGWDLYKVTGGQGTLSKVLLPVLQRDARWMRDAHDLVEKIEDVPLRQLWMASLFQWSQPFFTAFFGVNVLWIFVLRYILLATYAFLIAFYWVLTPYVAWTVVLPQTRPVFKGFVQSYIAVCAWPLLLGIVERLIGALPWNTWLPELTLNPSDGPGQFPRNQMVLFSMNAVFLAAIASIPIVASKTVSGAVRSSLK